MILGLGQKAVALTHSQTAGPASSASLNFNNKTLSEVIDLIEDISGLTAWLVSNPDNPSLTVQIRSEETGFQKGFRISGSGAATDERWTTPSLLQTTPTQ